MWLAWHVNGCHLLQQGQRDTERNGCGCGEYSILPWGTMGRSGSSGVPLQRCESLKVLCNSP